MNRKSVAFMILLPLFWALVLEGCKKDSSTTEPTATAEPTLTFTIGGVNYAGQAQATLRTPTTPHYLRVWTTVTPASGPWVKLEIFIEDTSLIQVNTPIVLKGNLGIYIHATVGDTTKLYCSQSTYSGWGTMTIAKWTGKEIVGSFGFNGHTHINSGLGDLVCDVTNGSFKASSIQEVP